MKYSTPKYKVGDIVRLLPYDFFDQHINIPGPYWTGLMDTDLTIKNVQKDSGYDLILNGETASCVYYGFKNQRYSWAEEYLKPTYSNFLKDKDFEI